MADSNQRWRLPSEGHPVRGAAGLVTSVGDGTFYDTIMKPALEAVGLPASRPSTDTAPAERGVRLHDLRHTFATMKLMAGTHFMQVSKWLGHGAFTLTLDTYGDWIPEEDGGAANNLPEPALLKTYRHSRSLPT